MADDDLVEGGFEDVYDPRLADRFEALMRVPAPDTWERARGDGDGAAPGARFRRPAAAAAVAVLATVGSLLFLADGDDETSVAAEGGDPTTGPAGPAGDPCRIEQLAAALREGMPTYDYEPSGSPQELAARTEMVVWGELIDATAGPPEVGGTRLVVRAREAVGSDGRPVDPPAAVWIDTEPPEGQVQAGFVAFLAGDVEDGSGEQRTMAADVEGLWIACDLHSPALPVLVSPVMPGWDSVLSGGVSLEELWENVRYPNGQLITQLAGPSVVEDGAAVYDLRLADGDRFRLSLPQSLSGEWTLMERPAPAPIQLESERGRIEVLLGDCGSDEQADRNALGSAVHVHDSLVSVCRPGQMIGMNVFVPPVQVRDHLDTFDLRPIEVGGRYEAVLAPARSGLEVCGGCSSRGPVSEAGVVVNAEAGAGVSAVDERTLAHLWSYDGGTADVWLHPGSGGIFVSAAGEHFAMLDPATGEERWRVALDPGEVQLMFDRLSPDVSLLRSSLQDAAEGRSSVLRRIDLDAGEVLWESPGRSGARWQSSDPAAIDDLVVVLDLRHGSSDPVPGGIGLLAFEVETGQPAWTTELPRPGRSIDSQVMNVLEVASGRVLVVHPIDDGVVRVDPADGEVLWRASVPGGEVTGTEYAPDGSIALHLKTPDGAVLLDPDTGERIAPPDGGSGSACPVTRPPEDPFVPPEPWPSAPADPDLAWFGTAELWTVLDRDGYTPRKSVWWSADFRGGQQEPAPEIEVVYERLDAEADPIVLGGPGTNAFTAAAGWFMIAGIEPGAEPGDGVSGCWRATATYRGATLSYVYEVG